MNSIYKWVQRQKPKQTNQPQGHLNRHVKSLKKIQNALIIMKYHKKILRGGGPRR